MLIWKCLLAMLILMLVILMLILVLLNLNTGYADTDADLCIRIMSLCCTFQSRESSTCPEILQRPCSYNPVRYHRYIFSVRDLIIASMARIVSKFSRTTSLQKKSLESCKPHNYSKGCYFVSRFIT